MRAAENTAAADIQNSAAAVGNIKEMKKNKKKKKNKTDLKFLQFLLPGALGVAVFILIPFIDSFRRSFCTNITQEFSGADNYKEIFGNEAFRLAIKNTLRFTGVCLPLLIGISFIIAYMLSGLKRIQLIRSILLFPMAIPTATMVLIWKILFSDHGYINGILDSHGADTIGFLDDKAFWLLVGSYIWKNLGYTVLLWLTGIMSISSALCEAAKTDGAGEFKCLFYIIMPNLKPTLYTITIISFLNSFKVFREAYLLAGSYPHESIYLLQHLFNNWFVNMDLGKMAAASVCVFSVIFIAVSLLKAVWDKEEN